MFFTANPEADLNGDKMVDFADLAILKSMFFSAPGPGPGEVPEGLRPDQRADLKVVQISTTPVYPVPGESVDVRVEVHSSSRTGMRFVKRVLRDVRLAVFACRGCVHSPG